MALQTLGRKTHYSLSLYRLIGILAVLCTHCLWILVDAPLPWRMFLLSEPRTGFMALSGFLYSQKYVDNVKGFYIKNYRKLLLPLLEGLVFLLIANIISMAATQNWDFISVWKGGCTYQGDKSVIYQFSNWYYIFWMCFCYLMLPMLNRFDKNIFKAIIIVLLIANFAVVCFVYPGLKLFFPAFCFGYFFGKKKWTKYFDPQNNNWLDLILWLVIMAFAIGLFTLGLYQCPQNLKLAEVITIVTGAVWGTGTLFFLTLFFNLFMKNVERCRFLSWTDGVCYFIFIFNQCWGVGGTDVRQWTDVLWAQCVLFLVLAIVTSILMFYVNKGINKGIDKAIAKHKQKKLAPQPS